MRETDSMAQADAKLRSIVEMAMSVLSHEIGCDDCFEFFAAYADHIRNGNEIPEPLRTVAEHLERCPACTEEMRLLVVALEAAKIAG